MLLIPSPTDLDYQSMVNWDDPLTHGLVFWHVNLPGRYGGTRAYDLVSGRLLTRTGMALPPTSTSGPGTTTRPGGWGEERCDGTNDFLSFPALNLGTVHVISAWVQWQALGTLIIGGVQANNQYWGYTAGGLIYYSTSNSVSVSFTYTPTLGAWAHVYLWRLGTAIRLFINGVQVDSEKTLTANDALSIGAIGAYTSGVFPWNGEIDDMQFFAGVNMAGQAPQLYEDSRTSHPRMLRRVEGPWSGGTSGALTQSFGGTLASSGGLPRTITKALAGAV